MLGEIMKTEAGRVIVSIILGLGLAAMFRDVCKEGRCVVVKGPPAAATRDQIYQVGDECYRYTPRIVKCSATATTV